jgi:hypothetical protein
MKNKGFLNILFEFRLRLHQKIAAPPAPAAQHWLKATELLKRYCKPMRSRECFEIDGFNE